MRSPDEMVRAISRLTARARLILASTKGQPLVSRSEDQLEALAHTSAVLQGAGIRYALIGGHAVGIYSQEERPTKDVDVAVLSDSDRDHLISLMEAAGFIHRGTNEHTINFRHPNGEPVQLAMDASFDGPIGRATLEQIMGQPIPVVTRDDLLEMKRRAAADPRRRRSSALKDQADILRILGDVPDEDEGW